MPKISVIYSFFLTIALLAASVVPSTASANTGLSLLWEKEIHHTFYEEIAKTSTKGTLLSTYEVIDVVEYQQVYRYH